MRVSLVIPVYNEEKRIGGTLEKYEKYFTNLKNKGILDFDILVVINNTTDSTEEIVKNAINKYKEIRYINFPNQKGKGFAITKGFKDALKRKNDLIGFVDADMSTKPDAFYDLVKNIEDYDGIIASRRMKESVIAKSIQRSIISFTFNSIVRMLFWLPYRDTQCGAKIFTREAIEAVIDELSEKGWIFDIDLLYRLKKKGFKIKEVPTTWEDKAGSKIEGFFKTSLKMFWELIKLRFLKNDRYTRPKKSV